MEEHCASLGAAQQQAVAQHGVRASVFDALAQADDALAMARAHLRGCEHAVAEPLHQEPWYTPKFGALANALGLDAA